MTAGEAIRRIKLLKMAKEKLPAAWEADIDGYVTAMGDSLQPDDDTYAGTEGMIELFLEVMEKEIARIRQPFDGIDLGV